IAPYPGILQPPNNTPVELDKRVGLVNVWADQDGILRRADFQLRNKQLNDIVNAGPDAIVESLETRALRKLDETQRIPGSFESLRFRSTAPPGAGFRLHPVGDLLATNTWKANYNNGAFFRDKLVFIGPTANILHDIHSTPLGEMTGPEIHLNILNAALHGE